uniref:Uncharacterized protein n=1 Tax=Avena sativa TaxID=4498 RepID=A0ACD5TQF0_AVESA
MQPARPPCLSSRKERPRAAPHPPRCSHRHRQLLALAVIVVCLVGGGSTDALLLAVAPPVRRLGPASSSSVATYDVIGSRPVPEESATPSSPSSPPAAGFADDKRPIPSCPDMLHNR